MKISAKLLLTAATLGVASSSFAATLNWDPAATGGAAGGGAGTWNTTNAFWWNGTADAAWANANNDTAVFGGTGATVSLGAPVTANGLIFNSTGYTISGNTLTLAGAAPTITVTTAGQTAVINSNLAGSAGLTLAGAGDLTLGGTNTYTGGTTINGGIVRVANVNNAAFGTTGITVGGNATLATASGAGNRIVSNAITVNSGVTLSTDGGYTDLFLSGVVSGAGAFSMNSSGNVFLTNTNNSFSGGVTQSGSGTLWGASFGNAGANGSFGSGNTITVSTFAAIGYTGAGETTNKTLNFSTGNGGIFTNNAASSSMSALTLSSVTTANAALGLTFGGSSDTVISNGITGNSNTLNFTKSGVGTVTINNNAGTSNMFGAAIGSNITLSGGVLVLNGATGTNQTFIRSVGSVVQFGSGSAVLTATTNTNGILGGWATFGGTGWAANSTNVAGGTVGALASYTADTSTSFTGATANEDVQATITNVAAGSANSLRFNTAGAQTLTLTGINFLTSGGILITSNVGANATTLTGGTLAFGTSGVSSTGDIVINNLNTSSGANFTLGSVIANNATGGTTSLTVAGPGTTTLTATSTYTGTTFVQGGATLIQNGTHTTGGYTVAADSTLYLKNGFSGYGPNTTINGGGTAATTGLYLNGGQTYAFSPLNLTGAATTVRSYGTGAATLSSFDSNGIHLTVADTASGSVISSGVNLTSNGYGFVMNIASGANNATGDLVVNSILTGSAPSGPATVGGVTVDFQINKSGTTGSINLTGSNTYTHGLAIEAGSLILSSGDNRLPAANALVLGLGANSAQVVLNGISQTVGNLIANGTGTANAVVGGSATLSTLTLSSASAINYSGLLGGAGVNQNNLALVKAGTGTATLSGATTFTGGITVNAGRLNLTGGNVSAIAVNSGATLGSSTGGSTTGLLTMNGGSIISITGGATTTAFTSNGVTFAGATALNADSALIAANVYTVLNVGSGTVTGLSNLTSLARGTFGTTGSSITFTAGGTLTDTWNTTSGTWDAGTTASWSNGSDGKFYLGDTVIFNTPGAASTVTLSGTVNPASITFNNTSAANTYTLSGSGSIVGSGSLTMAGAGGTTTISTANTYSGGTSVTAGTLVAGNATAFGTGAITVNGGTLSSGTFTLANAVTLTSGSLAGSGTYAGAVSLGGGSLTGTQTFSGVVSGSASVSVASTGIVTLTNAANTFSGTLNVTSGTLTYYPAVSNGSAYVLAAAGTALTMGSGTTLNVASNELSAFGAAVSYTAGSAINLNGATLNITGGGGAIFQRLLSTSAISITGSSTIAQNGGGYGAYASIEGAIGGSGDTTLNLGRAAVSNSGGSWLNLKGSQSGFAGSVVVSASANTKGEVIFGDASGWGAGSLTLAGTNSNVVIGDLAATETAIDANLNTGWTGGSALSFQTGTLAAAGAITVNAGANLMVNNGAGRAIIVQTNGGLTVNGGTVSTIGTGGTSAFATNGSTWTFGGTAASTVSAPVQLNAAGSVFNVTSSAGPATISGTISGSNGLAVNTAGTGVLTLSGLNTYTGATVVNGGTLLVNGSLASAVNIIAGAILGGTGTVNGAITVNGRLQGGAGLLASGSLTTGAGAVTLASGSVIQLALGAPGAASTIVVGSGGITFQSNQSFSFLNIGGAAAPGTYTLISGAATGLTTSGWTIANPGWSGTFSDTAGTISLTLTAVPEPSVYGLVGAGALAGVALVRRRRKTA